MMPFDWYRTASVPAHVAQRQRTRAAAQAAEEARGHAELLRRLGYSRAQARARVAANFAWEHDRATKATAATLAAVLAATDAVYATK